MLRSVLILPIFNAPGEPPVMVVFRRFDANSGWMVVDGDGTNPRPLIFDDLPAELSDKILSAYREYVAMRPEIDAKIRELTDSLDEIMPDDESALDDD